MYNRKNYPLAEPAQLRLYEIQLYLIVYHLIKDYELPNVSVDFIEYLAKIHNCNDIYISKAVLACIKKDPNFVPRLSETHVLLYKAGYPVRTIHKITRSSNQTIYKHIDAYNENPYPIQNKLSKPIGMEIKKLLEGLYKLSDIINIG